MAIDLPAPAVGVPAGPAPATRRARRRDLALASRQLAVLLGAGVPIVATLRLAAEQTPPGAVQQALADLARRVEHGSSLSDAASAHPAVFGPLYLGLLRAGEAGGVLESVLQRLAAHLERSERLRRTVLGALAYPAVVVSAALAVTAVLLGWVVPVFAGVFTGAGAELPAATRLVLRLSAAFQTRGPIGAAGAAVAAAGLALWWRTPPGRDARDRWLLQVPGLGTLIGKAAVARATRTLGTLLGCGVALLEALEIAGATAGNRVVERAFADARGSLAAGASLAGGLGGCPAMPAMVRQMIAVGEATGTLDVMLARAADCCDDDVETAAAALSAMLEPALILFLGVVIGGLVVAMYLPVFRLGAMLG